MVCYDISNPKRLTKTAKTLENYGIRIQKSFFQCEMNKQEMEDLKNELLQIIDIRQDYLFVYPLCGKCTKNAVVIGQGQTLKLETYFIL
jgi:CRISPR-associated protein Cas2